MTIEELSIGDWVRCEQFAQKHKIEETHPCKVVRLEDFVLDCCVWLRAVTTYQDGRFLKYKSHIDHESIPVKHLTPIPLTPEILEKNGWVHYGPCHWRNRDIKCSCFRFGRKYWDIHTRGSRVYRPTRISIENILHVHQLQHALRLAGVEKEIEV